MKNNCFDINLMAYSGTSQSQRMLNALSSTYAQVDERSTADLILFAKNYSEYLNYFDVNNQVTGTWQSFMNNDPAVIISDIMDWRSKDFIPFTEYIITTLQQETNAVHAQELFKSLFDLVFSLATKVDNSYNSLGDDIPFKKYLNVSIGSNLAYSMNVLWKFYDDFKISGTNVLNESIDYIDLLIPVDHIIFSGDFSIDQLHSTSWQIPLFTAPGITLDSTADIITNINGIVTHNLFSGAIQSFLNGVIKIVSETSTFLNDVLENYAAHQPHYALYLTFVRLFKFSRNKINNFTKEHLDFYYKSILLLKNAEPLPDDVFLLFELQKNTADHILKKSISFKAGKDANNNDLFYALANDVVLHHAGVKSLKSLFLNKTENGILYASPVANSDDGNGAKLTSIDNSWVTFGDSKKTKQAVIGFAIASNILYLQEGTRTVTLTFECSDNLSGIITADSFVNKCFMQFTGEKKWFDPSSFDPSASVSCVINDKRFSLSVSIPGNAPAIIPYSSKVYGGNFTEALPMLQLQLTDYTTYSAIKSLVITSIAINVDVKDVKDVILQNDDGKINAAKPFKLFGEFPEQKASLIIGSKEIFQKKLESLTINFTWQTAPVAAVTTTTSSSVGVQSIGQAFEAKLKDTNSVINVESGLTDAVRNSALTKNQSTAVVDDAEIDYLIKGKWTPLANTNDPINVMRNQENPVVIGFPELTEPAAVDFTPNEEYQTTSIDGFLKIQLNDNSFNLATYLYNVRQSVAKTSVKIVTNGTTATYTPNMPPAVPVPDAPAATGVSLDYLASKTILLSSEVSKRTDFFYHIDPFGFREIQASFTKDKLTLLPVFDLDDGIKDDNGGELWIGLNNAHPLETVTILFQVADGTSNPLKQMTAIDWFYLSNNNWVLFDPLLIIDQSNNLTRSGIVTVTIPSDASTDNTVSDKGLIWIKAVVVHDTDAVCNLVAVTTNAARTTLIQDIKKNSVFTKTLARGTISKANVADAAIKKINQPNSSFGGRISETDDQFYVRVSERLKHKQRAVTSWDYERLVLQNYPQIHKVKCISHTGLITDKSNNQKYSETLPGHVTIVTVPSLVNNTSTNLLRPYTSIGLLAEIQTFLQQLTSPFIVSNKEDPTLNRLHVLNPQFEEVQFDFSVMFLPDHDPTFFVNQLNTDIEQFLTPWAFELGSSIEFGGTLTKSVVLNFIEEREYVDYVTCFRMNQIIGRDDSQNTPQVRNNIEEAVATTARSILVSYNDGKKRHTILSLSNCDCNA